MEEGEKCVSYRYVGVCMVRDELGIVEIDVAGFRDGGGGVGNGGRWVLGLCVSINNSAPVSV